jgi:hypothetical protein
LGADEVHVSNLEWFKQDDPLSPLLFSGRQQLLVYADAVNILGGSIHIIKKNTHALVVASKEVCL